METNYNFTKGTTIYYVSQAKSNTAKEEYYPGEMVDVTTAIMRVSAYTHFENDRLSKDSINLGGDFPFIYVEGKPVGSLEDAIAKQLLLIDAAIEKDAADPEYHAQLLEKCAIGRTY